MLFRNPLFQDPSNADFHLTENSPAIDEGANLVGIVNDDFDGTERPQNGVYDIGAYEFVDSYMDIYPPDRPTNLVAVGDTDAIHLNWNASDSSDVSKYLIYKSAINDTTQLALIDSVNYDTTSYTNVIMTNDLFYYRIKAKDYAGCILF